MKKIKSWDNRVVRLQDKGARFIVLDKQSYCDKILDNITSGGSHKTVQPDPTAKHEEIVLKWAKNGSERGK